MMAFPFASLRLVVRALPPAEERSLHEARHVGALLQGHVGAADAAEAPALFPSVFF